MSNPGTNEKHALYIPAAFAEPDLTQLHDFIEHNSFGLLLDPELKPEAFINMLVRSTLAVAAALRLTDALTVRTAGQVS